MKKTAEKLEKGDRIFFREKTWEVNSAKLGTSLDDEPDTIGILAKQIGSDKASEPQMGAFMVVLPDYEFELVE